MSSGKFKRAVSSVLAAVLLTATAILPTSSALAQTASTGVITGVVQNEKGEVVPNATVRAVNTGTNATREVKASSEGVYEITQLAPGTYRVEVEAQGFSKSVTDDVAVNVLQRTTVCAPGPPESRRQLTRAARRESRAREGTLPSLANACPAA